MSKVRILFVCAAVVGLALLLNGIGTNESRAESPGTLYVLLEYDGGYAEFNFNLTVDELTALFPESLFGELLEGQPVHLSPQEAFTNVSVLVDVADWSIIKDVVLLAAETVVPATWTCIKCCYAEPPLACCCKPKEDP